MERWGREGASVWKKAIYTIPYADRHWAHKKYLEYEISYSFPQWPSWCLDFLCRVFLSQPTVYGLVSMEFHRENGYAFSLLQRTKQ